VSSLAFGDGALSASFSTASFSSATAPAQGSAAPVDLRDTRIAELEAELARMRGEVAQLRSSRLPPDHAGATSGAAKGVATGRAVTGARSPASGAVVERDCPYPCGVNGTCNRMTGECRCPAHRTGKDCAEAMFPACANMWGYDLHVAPCGLPEATFPVTCECAEQCDSANVLMRRMCFEHRPPGDPGRDRARKWFTGATEERWLMTTMDSPDMLRIIHERAAKSREEGSCNGHGIWMPKLPRWLDPPGPVTGMPADKFDPNGPEECVCMPTHWGSRCEHDLRAISTCINDCSKHGRCVRSNCACDEGYWGVDCSLKVGAPGQYSTVDNGAVAPPNNGVAAKVFVYELPNQFTTWLAAQSNAYEWTHSWWFYDNDISLHQRFLASPYRTANPDEADFFFLPLYRSLGAYTAGWGPGVITPKGWRAFGAARDYVDRTWPFWKRKGGRDHMMVITCDVGYGTLGVWENQHFVHHSVLPRAMRPIKYILQWGGHPTRQGYDLVIPPRTPPQEVFSAAGAKHPFRCAATGPGKEASAPAKVTDKPGNYFYFRGKIILDNPVYSQGVRQAVYRAHHHREGWVISDQSTKAFYREMLEARFCFAPTGWGWGQRVFEAILSGCIPVIMQSDNLQPFEGILPWKQFAVMLNESDIPNLHEVLAAIPQAKVESMQRTLSCVWPRLTFFSSPTQRREFGDLYQVDAFDMMMLELSQHADKARGAATPSAAAGPAVHAWQNASKMLTTSVCSCVMEPSDFPQQVR